jgi:hypothetical protein
MGNCDAIPETIRYEEDRVTRGWKPLIAVVGITAVIGGACLAPSPGTPPPPARDQNVTRGDNGGEAEMAVDPTNPRHMVLVDMLVPTALDPVTTVQKSSSCSEWITDDGGSTWRQQPLPITDTVYFGCADPYVTAGPDGILYAGAIEEPGEEIATDRLNVIRSTDGGVTWSTPKTLVAIEKDAPNKKIDRADREFAFVDQSTGTAYIQAADAVGEEVFVSHDRGLNWSAARTVTSSEYPGTSTPGGDAVPTCCGDLTAAHGVLAAVFPASSVPQAGAHCPCPVFETSTDEGRTWTSHRPAPAAQSMVRADPTHPGRYALLQQAGGSGLPAQPFTTAAVWVTEDSGATWSGPVSVTEPGTNPHFKPWINYGPSGVLGVMWKTRYSDSNGRTDVGQGVFDAWAAVSHNGGHTFGPPIRLSSARSPMPPITNPIAYNAWIVPAGGDDFSWLTVDRCAVHVLWGDARTSPQDPSPNVRSVYYAPMSESRDPTCPRRGSA